MFYFIMLSMYVIKIICLFTVLTFQLKSDEYGMQRILIYYTLIIVTRVIFKSEKIMNFIVKILMRKS